MESIEPIHLEGSSKNVTNFGLKATPNDLSKYFNSQDPS